MSHATRSTKEDVEIAGSERARGDGTLNIAVLLGQWEVGVMCNVHVVWYSFPSDFMCCAHVVRCSSSSRFQFFFSQNNVLFQRYPMCPTAGAGCCPLVVGIAGEGRRILHVSGSCPDVVPNV